MTESAKDTVSTKPIPFSTALAVFLITYCIVFSVNLHQDTGVYFTTKLFEHPEYFADRLVGALGAYGLPTLHVMIASFFESQRNANSRRKIFTYWSIVLSFSIAAAPIVQGF